MSLKNPQGPWDSEMCVCGCCHLNHSKCQRNEACTWSGKGKCYCLIGRFKFICKII